MISYSILFIYYGFFFLCFPFILKKLVKITFTDFLVLYFTLFLQIISKEQYLNSFREILKNCF